MEDMSSGNNDRLKVILSIIFLSILLLAISLYVFNRPFKNKMNTILSNLPGPLGGYFETSSESEGDDEKKEQLASHYLSLEPTAAADKLYIIKKHDGKLYNQIIKKMNSKSTSRTEELIMLVRDIENNSGELSMIYETIIDKKQGSTSSEASRLSNQDLIITINEIEMRMDNDKTFKEILPNVMEGINSNRIAEILYYIDDSIEEKIKLALDDTRKAEVENLLLSKKNQTARLIDLAGLYETKPIDTIIEEIGNDQEYSMEELGLIYSNLSILKSAEILSQIEDDSFIEELYAAIRADEELNGIEDSVTNNISKAMQFMTEYNKKIDDLVIVYSKMNAGKAAEIAERMMDNEETVTALEIDAEPMFEISDSSIMIDVLSRMKNKSLSNIMNHVDVSKASRLTQMLAEP